MRYVIVEAEEPEPGAPPRVTDTQVVSYAMKGVEDHSVANATISSTVAHEFLGIRDLTTGKPRYFVPTGASLTQRHLPRHHGRGPRFRGSADRLHLDFDNTYPSIVEHSHRGIARAVTDGDIELFGLAVQHLPAAEARKLTDRFSFLVSMRVRCLPLMSSHIEVAYVLVKELLDSGFAAKGDFRNTLNDMLILAVALEAVSAGGVFETRDKLLGTLARPYFDSMSQHGDLIRFVRNPVSRARRPNRDSKGYINAGWRYQFR
ncbi:hypothetical protein NX801_05800 [Streptomyces sp. LP05-1]|uniref:Uncharacterized protein n=1 Tax=Streptomyces pyxinae TaxID=2970734 RepID=A0ABT2CCN8_9ACTN|nr:hypothetical protein [Streptomyces sp. LP05-1]MCS0635178.1 hypothetical protein [Streptomyces sp. LP05-1]